MVLHGNFLPKQTLLGLALLLLAAANIAAADWPVLASKETGRVAVATTGNTYTVCTQIPLTKAWNRMILRIDSVLDAAGATIPGNAGLALRLNKTSKMPTQAATMASCYKVMLPSVPEYEEWDQSTSSIQTYYADTTLTAGDLTKVNLIFDTWKLLRQ